MVEIKRPPPTREPDPVFRPLPPGEQLLRVWDPTRYNTAELGFRLVGPYARFDHHRGRGSGYRRDPDEDPERSVYYAAPRLSSCLVEVFGDAGSIDFGDYCVASIHLRRELRLLELQEHGAMRAGTVAAISKVSERECSQEWSRYFYEADKSYTKVDGLIYSNAHNEEAAVLLYERAIDALECRSDCTIRLDDPSLRAYIDEVAQTNNLPVV
jgi:hypothetical protein